MAEESQYEEAIRNINALKKLVASDGWQIFVDIGKEQMHDRTQPVVLKPLTDIGGVLHQEFTKGEIAGITVMLAMPEVQIEASEAILEALKGQDDGSEEEDSD
jgi:hypothetical protein